MWVDFKICLTAPGKVMVVFSLVRSIAFDAFRSLSSVCKDSMSLFPAVLILGNTGIHIGSTNGGNVASYIEAMFNLEKTLMI